MFGTPFEIKGAKAVKGLVKILRICECTKVLWKIDQRCDESELLG
jgi:hypothetical protein